MKKVIIVVLVIVIGAGIYLAVNRPENIQDQTGDTPTPVATSPAGDTSLPAATDQAGAQTEIPTDVLEHIGQKSDMIIVNEPEPMSEVTSPLTFRGEARGNWFFEADFPVVLVDWDGVIIAEGIATATADWTTEEFVPFEGSLEFENPSFGEDFSQRGTLIFQKNNPSGLPENDDALEIPVLFAPPSE